MFARRRSSSEGRNLNRKSIAAARFCKSPRSTKDSRRTLSWRSGTGFAFIAPSRCLNRSRRRAMSALGAGSGALRAASGERGFTTRPESCPDLSLEEIDRETITAADYLHLDDADPQVGEAGRAVRGEASLIGAGGHAGAIMVCFNCGVEGAPDPDADDDAAPPGDGRRLCDGGDPQRACGGVQLRRGRGGGGRPRPPGARGPAPAVRPRRGPRP